ncbi:hypothetical protein NVP2095A_28 [Vibrio phage 2.095.A._10N.286.46.E10]|nr:hypothetical protein NVP2095A_28 [Vibrio phage 2.095.A._10N.286.46.E10]AUS02186.1 hypothetical protein NVP2095B_28 [Vibrio phage 2.095.B._10N.286.46.E10]
MKGQMVFSYKKGQKVPSWVQYLSEGNWDSEDLICEFGSNGKLYILPNGDIVTYAHRERDRSSSCIYIDNAHGIHVTGAGDNKNIFHHFSNYLKKGRLSGCTKARKATGIKVTTKTKPIPEKDPRVLIAF